MYTISVIPLTKNPFTDTLTYFSKEAYTSGTLLTIPIRNSEVLGMVVDCNPVSTTKTALRMASFSLRKLPVQTNVQSIPQSLIELGKSLTLDYPVTLRTILFNLLSPDMRNGSAFFPPQSSSTPEKQPDKTSTLTALTPDRYTYYQSYIRSSFAKQGSVLFVVPTTASVPYAYQQLSRGIESHSVILSSNQTKRNKLAAYKKIATSTHPLLIITTPHYAYVERDDTTSLILEQSGNTQWIDRTRPYLDHRYTLTKLASITGRECLLGDTFLPTDIEYKRRSEYFATTGESPTRLIFPAKLSLIKEEYDPTKEKPFKVFFDKTTARIEHALSKRENVFLYAARRGLAPLITCFDCGQIVRDPDSGSPYSLLRTYTKDGEEKRWFVDNTSGKRVRAHDVCEHCGSWRLREQGIGIQHIEKVCQELFPDTPLVTFDSTTASTPKKIRELTKEIQAMQGGIILGTALALPYIPPISVSCITSLEAAHCIPSWRADEILLRLIFELREKSSKEVLLQARNEAPSIITYAKQGTIEKFYDEELSLREMMQYPPFTNFYLLTWQETDTAVENTSALQEKLDPYNPYYYQSPHSLPHKRIKHALIKTTENQQPDSTLMETLRSLPPYIKIQRNPDRIV